MKTQLTKEESQHLIDLGVPKEKASAAMTTIAAGDNIRGIVKIPTQPIFTLTDLLDILPKEIEIIVLNKYQEKVKDKYIFILECFSGEYRAFYKEIALSPRYTKKHRSEELIDALYELCVWCIENKYLKL